MNFRKDRRAAHDAFYNNRMLAERAFIVCACAARLSCYMEKRKIQRRISENTDWRKIEK